MESRRASGLPQALERRANRVVRPRDLRDVYPFPDAELRRLESRQLVTRLAHGYYLRPPDVARGTAWRPEVEAVALGVAVADYSRDDVALGGASAARYLGAIPRALSTGVVFVPKQRPALSTSAGRVCFVKRPVAGLDVQRVDTPVVAGWRTSAEQTILDLADRPTLGGIMQLTASEAIESLSSDADWSRIVELAHVQRKPSALARAAWIASGVIEGPEIPAPRRSVADRGMRAAPGADRARYRIAIEDTDD